MFYKKTRKIFPDAVGMSVMEFAEYLEKQEGLKTKLKEKSTEAAGKDAPARWSTVDLLVGLIANTLE